MKLRRVLKIKFDGLWSLYRMVFADPTFMYSVQPCHLFFSTGVAFLPSSSPRLRLEMDTDHPYFVLLLPHCLKNPGPGERLCLHIGYYSHGVYM